MSGTWIFFFPVLLCFCSYYQVCWWKPLGLQTFIWSLSSARHQPRPCTHVFRYRLWIICVPALSLNSASSFPGHFTYLCGGPARSAIKLVSVSCIARGQWGGEPEELWPSPSSLWPTPRVANWGRSLTGLWLSWQDFWSCLSSHAALQLTEHGHMPARLEYQGQSQCPMCSDPCHLSTRPV